MDFWHLRLSSLSHGRLYALVHPLWKWILKGCSGIREHSQVLPLEQVFGFLSVFDCMYLTISPMLYSSFSPSSHLSFLLRSVSLNQFLSLSVCNRFHNDDRVWCSGNLKTISNENWTIIFTFITGIAMCICMDCRTYSSLGHGLSEHFTLIGFRTDIHF